MSFEGWREVELTEVIEFNPKESLRKGMLAKKVSMANLKPFTRKIQGYSHEKYSSGSKFRNGDTLLSRITPCLENGKTAYVDILQENEVAFGSTEFIILRGREGKADKKFVYYLTISPNFRDIAIKSMTGTTGRQRAQVDVLERAKFLFPPIEEQRRIACVLSCIDDKIELNNRINKTLEEMAQAIFKSWFVDFEPFRDGEFVESELGMIPKGWTLGSVYDFISEVNEKNRKREDYPVLTVTKEGKYLLSEEYFTKRVYSKDTGKYKVIRKYEVGFNPSRANIGSIAMLREFETGLLSPIYKVFRIHSRIKPVFFRYYMKQKGFIQRIAHYSSGTTRQNFDLDGFKYFPICVPPLEIQEQFNRLISPIEQMINANENENCKLSSIRDTLLPKLMSGEIRVPLD